MATPSPGRASPRRRQKGARRMGSGPGLCPFLLSSLSSFPFLLSGGGCDRFGGISPGGGQLGYPGSRGMAGILDVRAQVHATCIQGRGRARRGVEGRPGAAPFARRACVTPGKKGI
jgi:hypothetical protein